VERPKLYQTVHVDGTPLAEPARMDDPAPISESLSLESHGKLNRGRSERRADTTEEERDDVRSPQSPRRLAYHSLSPPGHWKNLFIWSW
jgi:hypothetical protein